MLPAHRAVKAKELAAANSIVVNSFSMSSDLRATILLLENSNLLAKISAAKRLREVTLSKNAAQLNSS